MDNAYRRLPRHVETTHYTPHTRQRTRSAVLTACLSRDSDWFLTLITTLRPLAVCSLPPPISPTSGYLFRESHARMDKSVNNNYCVCVGCHDVIPHPLFVIILDASSLHLLPFYKLVATAVLLLLLLLVVYMRSSPPFQIQLPLEYGEQA